MLLGKTHNSNVSLIMLTAHRAEAQPGKQHEERRQGHHESVRSGEPEGQADTDDRRHAENRRASKHEAQVLAAGAGKGH